MDLLADKSTLKKENAFFSELDNKSTIREASIYVHIPFCDSKCAFCGFDKVKNTNEIPKYKDRIIEEN